MQLIKSTEKILKENLTLNVENHYFDDDIEGCDNKILEDNKLSTVVKFKDTSGKNRPVREHDLLLDKILYLPHLSLSIDENKCKGKVQK